jgi:hypothetical protein
MGKTNADILEDLYLQAERKLLVRNKEEFAKAIGYSRGRLHTKMAKNDIDQTLLDKANAFVNCTENVIQGVSEVTAKDQLPLDNLAHISASHHELAHAHRVQAEILLIEAKKGQSLVDTNKELVLLLKNSGAPLKNEPAPLPPFEVAYYELLQVGVLEGRWRSMDEARAKLDKIVYENQVQQNEVYKHSSDSN